MSHTMSYDLFISYSRRDNTRHQVAALAEQIKAAYRAFAGHELKIFFDIREIHGMDDWRQKIQRSLRESHLFLAVLSPSYLASPYCRWEWEDYVRYEAMRQCLGEGVAPVYFITLPDAADPVTDRVIGRWLHEIHRRQTFDLRPWYDAGEKALQQAHVKETLEKLHASVRERIDRAGRARRSPANVLRHNPQFVGRVRELTELRNTLTKNKLGIVGARSPGVVATVQGVGGMGKTEIALAYAHAFAWDYPGGRWQLRCEHIADLRVALLQLAGPLGFEFTDAENKSLSLAFEHLLRELNRRERCLLLLDNISDPAILEPEYLDRLPRDGHVDLIATTRLAPGALPGSAQDQTFIAVDELPGEDALALLRSHQPEGRFPDQAEDDEAGTIARLLEGFTLAVETAAIYLGRNASPDACRSFRARLQADLLASSEQAASDPTVAVRHRERLLGRTLAFTFDTLPSEAIHLLVVASLLPADAVALPWLEVVAEIPAFLSTVDLLQGLRLFQTTDVSDASGRLLVARMHRLVQEEIHRRWPDDLAGQERALLDHLHVRARSLWNDWVDHARRWELDPLASAAAHWLEREGDDGPSLAQFVAVPLHHLGRFADAERLKRASVEKTSPDDVNYPARINNLGELLRDTNRLSEAESLYRRAILIEERLNGPEHPSVGITLNNLALLLQASNRFSEAETLFRRATLISERKYGPDHPGLAVGLNNLAALLEATNRWSEAEPLYRRALQITEDSLGPDHPDVANRLNNLAGLLRATNRFSEAEQLYRRALLIYERSLGPEHPAFALSLMNLATLLYDTNRLSEAELNIFRALSILERSFGPDHPKVASALGNLASLFRATNRLSEAEALLRRALSIDERSHGPDHPDIAIRLNNLADLLSATGRLTEAELLCRRALSIDEQSYGPDHPDVAIRLNNLAVLLASTNRSSEAEPLYRRAIMINERSFGPDHRDLPRKLNNLAVLLRATNRLSEAESLVRRALTIDERTYGPDHPHVASELNSLAVLLQAAGRVEEAESSSRRAVTILIRFKQTTGHPHPNHRLFIDNYAVFLSAMGYGEAEVRVRLNEIGGG
jgi:tetratricopeptide (TPR) repeat protein